MIVSEELSGTTRTKILQEYDQVGYAKSNSRSVLSSMNDLAYHYRYSLLEAGGVHSYLLPAIIYKLNRMPMGALDYRYSIEALKELYESAA